MRILIWFTCFTLMACATRFGHDRTRALLHIQNGNGHLAKGNHPAALGDFLRAEELDPKNPIVHNSLGLAYFLRGKYDLAEKSFRSAISYDGKFSEARNNLGRVLIERKKYVEAIAQLKKVESDLLYQSPDKTHANLGLAYFLTGEFGSAEKHFFQALQVRRSDCELLNYYGRSLLELNEYEKAVVPLDQAITACKTLRLEEPYYFSAMAYMKLGRREQAIARIKEGLEQYPHGKFAQPSQNMLEILR